MSFAVVPVKGAKFLVGFAQPPSLFLRRLKVPCNTDTHTHVLVDNSLCFLVVAREAKGVFVDTVQQFQHIHQFTVRLDVRQVDFRKTARFKVSKALFGTTLLL